MLTDNILLYGVGWSKLLPSWWTMVTSSLAQHQATSGSSTPSRGSTWVRPPVNKSINQINNDQLFNRSINQSTYQPIHQLINQVND